jgi:hypothetical protein
MAGDRAMSLTISGSPVASAIGSSAAFVPVIAGGIAPYFLSSQGQLPAGRSLSGLSVVGSYLTAGLAFYGLRVTDSTGAQADMTVEENIGGGGAYRDNLVEYRGDLVTYRGQLITCGAKA